MEAVSAMIVMTHARSEAHERLNEAPQPALQLDMALQRHQANAAVLGVHHRIMLDGLVGLVEIAGSVAAESVSERALEHAGPFRAGVAMPRQFRSGRGLEHEHAHALAR